MYPSAEYRLAVAEHLLQRALCGCLGRDCTSHGAYDPQDLSRLRAFPSEESKHPPDLIQVDGREPTQDDFNRLALVNPIVRDAMTALSLGGYRNERHALQCMVIALCRLNDDLLRRLAAGEPDVPPVRPVPADLNLAELDAEVE